MPNPFTEQPGILPNTCESRPPMPVPPDYRPPNSMPYTVKDGDHWGSVAARVKMDVKAFIEFNFKTTLPSHVNWYLHNYVGCTRVSADKSNFGFSATDALSTWTPRPGIIYVPAITPPPVPVPAPVPTLGCQDLLFSSVFYADSFVGDAIAQMAWIADEMDLLTTGGKVAGKVLQAANMVWLISGVLVVEIDGYSMESAYAWKFGTLLGAWNVPFTGSTHYTTDWKRVRFNMDVLDPRKEWNNKYASFTLGRSSLAVEVHKALARKVSGDYRPFPEQQLTVTRDLTIAMPVLQRGPMGIQTTLPGMQCRLVPLGYVTKTDAWMGMKWALEKLSKLKL